jgi:hypothetical protein
MPEERLTLPGDQPWTAFQEGIDFRLLFTSAETGRFTLLLRCQAGTALPPHRHLGAGEYFVVKGRMEYRMGTAEEGSYGYEPIGVVHEQTSFPVYTELFFTNHGAIAFLDEQGGVAMILDHATLEALAAGGA